MYELTGVDGFMIGRALYGAPWKIKQIMQKSLNEQFDLSQNQIIKTALKHFDLNINITITHGFN